MAEKVCSFYRGANDLSMGHSLGYCDLDCDRTTCDGDIHYCEKPDVLRKYRIKNKRREEELIGERRIYSHF